MKKDTPQTVKFKVLCRRLKLPHWQAVGLLESLWLFTSINAQDGAIGRYTNEEIAASIEWADDPDELVTVLVDARLLDSCESHRLIVHDWEEHCPSWLSSNFKKHNKQFAKPNREVGEQNGSNSDGKRPAKDLRISYETPTRLLRDSCEPPTSVVGISQKAPSHPIPVQSIPVQSIISPEQHKSDCSRLVMTEFEFPLKVAEDSDKPNTWTLPQSKFEEYVEAYPNVDVEQKIREARQFVRDNPTRRKTARGMFKFLTGWLNRNVNGKPSQGMTPAHQGPDQPTTSAQRLAKAFLQEAESA